MDKWAVVRDMIKTNAKPIEADAEHRLIPFSLRGLTGVGRVKTVHSGDCLDIVTTIDMYNLLRPLSVRETGSSEERIMHTAISNDCSGHITILLHCILDNVICKRPSSTCGKVARLVLQSVLDSSDSEVSYRIISQDGYSYSVELYIKGELVNDFIKRYVHDNIGNIAWSHENIAKTKQKKKQ